MFLSGTGQKARKGQTTSFEKLSADEGEEG